VGNIWLPKCGEVRGISPESWKDWQMIGWDAIFAGCLLGSQGYGNHHGILR
jgi:hypothetical protein